MQRPGSSRISLTMPALLLRLRGEALQGQVWAGKLLQKVVDAIPDSGGHFEMELDYSGLSELFDRASEESDRKKANQIPEPKEAGNGG